MAEPQVTATLTGKIKDFTRLDNLYAVVKREGEKLLTEWELKIDVTYEESEKSSA